MVYLTDHTLYEMTPPDPDKIRDLDDPDLQYLQLSLDAEMDLDFETSKQKKIDKQQRNQQYIIMLINIVASHIALSSGRAEQVFTFVSISWMIGCLADNIKSLQYYEYIGEFIDTCRKLEYHRLRCGGITEIHRGDVRIVGASYGRSPNLLDGDLQQLVIRNLTYCFRLGATYFLESPNGIGKSTLLEMFTRNLTNGEMFFGSTNKENLSFDTIRKTVCHLIQSSKNPQHLTKEEVDKARGKDPWLEDRLNLGNLFGRSTADMSGGEGKRMLLYIVLTCDAWILLLDETLDALDCEPAEGAPEGWLQRTINTIVEWNIRDIKNNKLIILIGHGLLDKIPNNHNVTKLKMEHTLDGTSALIPHSKSLAV
jgi:ABC-type iron transport system FetAB ATPase subunit